mmetsp:Transcript_7070/g.9511  ORF Transcript_7070/g.9511 Transcript_7070/m.9511 type:complete len:81 (-) Transcript_7070:1319-1561(-)
MIKLHCFVPEALRGNPNRYANKCINYQDESTNNKHKDTKGMPFDTRNMLLQKFKKMMKRDCKQKESRHCTTHEPDGIHDC